MLLKRCGSAADPRIQVQTYVASAGMDALTSALCAARDAHAAAGTKHAEPAHVPIERLMPNHDYLEVAYVVEDSAPPPAPACPSVPAHVFVANLNASAPRGRLDPSDLVAKLRHRCVLHVHMCIIIIIIIPLRSLNYELRLCACLWVFMVADTRADSRRRAGGAV